MSKQVLVNCPEIDLYKFYSVPEDVFEVASHFDETTKTHHPYAYIYKISDGEQSWLPNYYVKYSIKDEEGHEIVQDKPYDTNVGVIYDYDEPELEDEMNEENNNEEEVNESEDEE